MGAIAAILCVVFIGCLIFIPRETKEEMSERIEAKREVQIAKEKQQELENQKRMEKEKKYGVPRTAPLIWLNDDGIRYYTKDEYYIWKDKDHIKILGYLLNDNTFYDIPINNIKFFKQEGELRTETTIEGGGINKKGLVKGAVIGGAVGAVIGSKEKVTTKKETIDTRKGIIYLILNGEERILHMDYAAYKTFKRLIPTKDYDVVMFNNMQKQNV